MTREEDAWPPTLKHKRSGMHHFICSRGRCGGRYGGRDSYLWCGIGV